MFAAQDMRLWTQTQMFCRSFCTCLITANNPLNVSYSNSVYIGSHSFCHVHWMVFIFIFISIFRRWRRKKMKRKIRHFVTSVTLSTACHHTSACSFFCRISMMEDTDLKIVRHNNINRSNNNNSNNNKAENERASERASKKERVSSCYTHLRSLKWIYNLENEQVPSRMHPFHTNSTFMCR